MVLVRSDEKLGPKRIAGVNIEAVYAAMAICIFLHNFVRGVYEKVLDTRM